MCKTYLLCLQEVYLHVYTEQVGVMAGAVLQHSGFGTKLKQQ